jgi:CRP-like cAMP-binding protein
MRKVLYIFGLLTDGDVEWLARTGVRRRLEHGDVVIEEGRPIDSLVLLLEGEFSVAARNVGEVARLRPGEIVGEMSFVDSAPPSATVRARGACLGLFIDKAALAQRLTADTGFGCRFYKALAMFLADRLRETVQRLGDGAPSAPGPGTAPADELDEKILDTVSIAGSRFDWIMKVLGEGR